MKIINLQNFNPDKVHRYYFGVPMPMYTFDSWDELVEKHIRPRSINPIVINNSSEFGEFAKKYQLANRFTPVLLKESLPKDVEVWIKTVDRFIPVTRIGTEIIYEKDKEGNKIPTDACYVQLVSMYSGKGSYTLCTSSGVFYATITDWNITAAIAQQYKVELAPHGGRDRTAKARRDQLLNRNKINHNDVRVFHLMFNPLSQYFLKPYEAARSVWGALVNKEWADKYFNTERFKLLFAKELAMIMPELRDSLKVHLTPDKIAKMIEDTFEVGKAKGTVTDLLNVIHTAVDLAYDEPDNNMPQAKNLPMIDDKPVVALPSPNSVVKGETFLPEIISDEDAAELRLETGALSEYVIASTERKRDAE